MGRVSHSGIEYSSDPLSVSEHVFTKALGGIFHTERRELTGAGRSIVTRSLPFGTRNPASRCLFDVLE